MSNRWKATTGLKTALATAVLVGGVLISLQSASAQWLDRQTQQRIAAGYAASTPFRAEGKVLQ